MSKKLMNSQKIVTTKHNSVPQDNWTSPNKVFKESCVLVINEQNCCIPR